MYPIGQCLIRFVIFCFLIPFVISCATPHQMKYPPLPEGNTIIQYTSYITIHYIENMPEKPETNEELLQEYIKALKNIDKVLGEIDENVFNKTDLIE